MYTKINMILAFMLEVLTLVLIFVSATLIAQAQEVKFYNKVLSDGSKVYLKRYVISEIRSRPRSLNSEVPESELFDNQEWEIRKYFLVRELPNSPEESVVWKHTSEIRTNPKDEFPGIGSIRIRDVFISDNKIHVLYIDTFLLFVADIIKDDALGWYEYSKTELARDYESRPIFKAQFADKEKPEIIIQYDAGRYKRGTWKWRLNGEKWARK